MSSLPNWAVWSIVVPLLLLSPVIMFLLAVTIESLIWASVDAGPPALVLIGAAAAGLLLLRRLRGSRRAASGET